MKIFRNRIIAALCILLSIVLILLFLSQLTSNRQRQQRLKATVELAKHSAVVFNIPTAMVLAVIRTESDFHPDAVSSAGACGLMQLMPETFRFLRTEHLLESLDDDAIFDPAVNIHYGTYYLSYLCQKFGSWPIVLAAYNAGEGRVADWLKDPALSKNGQLQKIPFRETSAYIEKTMQAFEYYSKQYPDLP